MPRVRWILAFLGMGAVVLIGSLWIAGVFRPKGGDPRGSTAPAAPVPITVQPGEALFNTHCATCHGTAAAGTNQGPSLLWRIYAPNHHSDATFYLAVQRGVHAHHWRFGNMPPLPNVTEDEVTKIIAYVRWLQQQAGVY